MNKILILAMALVATPASSQVGSLLTIDALEGGISYTSAGPVEVQALTRRFTVPKGFKMVEVNHPDKIVCSAYPQASTWEMVRNSPYVAPKPKVTAEQAELLRGLLK